MSVKEEIKQLLNEAAKFYAAKDYEISTNLYSEANAIYDASTGSSNADYLYLYGKSLYMLALSHSDVFGGDDEQEEQEVEGDEEEESKKKQLYQFSDTLAEEEEDEEQETVNKGPSQEEDNSQQEEAQIEPQDEETPTSDFENAWEILELARSHYENMPQDSETLQKLSETYDILGEISLETENFPQAKQDFAKCLELRLKAYNDQDSAHRLIIESHYKLSLALEFDPSEGAECQKELERAIELLETRIKDQKAEKGDEGLLEELKVKLKELKVTEESFDTIKRESVAQVKQVLGVAPVNDLTSMVKKRKPKQDQTQQTKKQKK
ncbi:LANO_0F04500g1_1 [Lachancea nothofagi CBS 11611]|uniref:LANO_0F04500g1_1 n=1 Tax=Lachancea nothofagi CBS 11611 TaxID=1266666 RepID=A0A1G4K7L9_9SACH|nr:LANO_0F04500g1_1 [Lachancea nothofagi CBS 11611]